MIIDLANNVWAIGPNICGQLGLGETKDRIFQHKFQI